VTRRLLPFLLCSYLLAYIDRTNVGVAKLGMQPELGFTDQVIGLGAGIFFAGFVLLEIPGSLIVEHLSARKWLARMMVSWGLVACLAGFIETRYQFYGLRFLLGAAEAGFFPGVIVYLAHWFRYQDRAGAKAFFMVAMPIANAVGLPLSRLILEVAGWRWIFVVEGLPPVILGFVAWFYLTDSPREAKWLPADEKDWLIRQLASERQHKEAAGRAAIRQAFREPQIFLLGAVYFFVVMGNQALGFFLPSVTDTMTSISVSARTVVTALPYACSVFGILLNGSLCRRTRERRWHIAVPTLMAGVALACCIQAGGRLAPAVVFLCITGFCAQAYLSPFWTLPTALLTKSAAAMAVGLISTASSMGGFAGPYIFGYLKTSTGKFESGLWFLVACILISGLLATRIRNPGKELT
jgi:MFS family permease